MPGFKFATSFLVSLLLCSLVTAEPQRPESSDGHLDHLVKRGAKWQNLAGAWGKRGIQAEDVDFPLDYDQFVDKRDWNNFRGAWGKRAKWSNLKGSWGKRDQDNLNKRGDWNNFRGAWGKRTPYDDYIAESLDDPAVLHILHDQVTELAAPQQIAELKEPVKDNVEKRGWSRFFGSWGKRPFNSKGVATRSNNWSSLRGSWGKRSVNPAQLKEMSKKNTDWNTLRGAWGKRDDEQFDENDSSE